MTESIVTDVQMSCITQPVLFVKHVKSLEWQNKHNFYIKKKIWINMQYVILQKSTGYI